MTHLHPGARVIDTDVTTNTKRYDITALVERHGAVHIAERVGVHKRTVERWVHNGVDEFTADKIAVKVEGLNPASVWGRDWV